MFAVSPPGAIGTGNEQYNCYTEPKRKVGSTGLFRYEAMFFKSSRLSRSELETTKTEEKAIAAAATIGDSVQPNNG